MNINVPRRGFKSHQRHRAFHQINLQRKQEQGNEQSRQPEQTPKQPARPSLLKRVAHQRAKNSSSGTHAAFSPLVVRMKTSSRLLDELLTLSMNPPPARMASMTRFASSRLPTCTFSPSVVVTIAVPQCLISITAASGTCVASTV